MSNTNIEFVSITGDIYRGVENGNVIALSTLEREGIVYHFANIDTPTPTSKVGVVFNTCVYVIDREFLRIDGGTTTIDIDTPDATTAIFSKLLELEVVSVYREAGSMYLIKLAQSNRLNNILLNKVVNRCGRGLLGRRAVRTILKSEATQGYHNE